MNIRESDIAIVGLSCRFPGSNNIDEFWQNLLAGVDSISIFDREELELSDSPSTQSPNYVRAGAILPNIDKFDATFFGYSAREAEIMDPQQRIFLESAWTAFESAGYNPETYPGLVAVYAGSGMNGYLINNVHPHTGFSSHRTFLESARDLQVRLTNGKDYLPTRVSYKLNLTGPSLNVQTACSTSLVAVHLACQSLLNGECDLALAGGVAISVPQKTGYLYQEDMICSPDGKCRAFDAEAKGTVFGNGVGVVVLKLLSQALEDGDNIHATIKGSAINNDGALKVGYTAPSVEGQAAVISEALAVADVDASSINYVEAHGTGTSLGDPIEIAALTQAFRESSEDNGYCAIGSVKTNIGHLVEAAGMAGLVKTILSLKHKQIPPSLHFQRPNPNIDFANSPFYVNTTLSEWEANDGTPRRAGVSSFGMGGTNAHVILEEAPQPEDRKQETGNGERPLHLLSLSATTDKALLELAGRYVNYLDSEPEAALSDICFTANTGRKHFDHRLALVADSKEQLRQQLTEIASNPGNGIVSAPWQHPNSAPSPIVFLFTGQGSQYINMGYDLYATQPTFRDALDRCDEILRPYLDIPLLEVLYPDAGNGKRGNGNRFNAIDETSYTQPALFALEYALYQLWTSWGIEPDIVMGHSVGEYVAACVAGVFSLEDGLKLIAERGRLMQALPSDGEMVSLLAREEQVQAAIRSAIRLKSRSNNRQEVGVSIAAINGPESIVISGKREPIQTVCAVLEPEGIKTRRLTVSHAFHSPLMEPMLAEFEQVARQINYSSPNIKLISNVTGALATAEVATPGYWCRHVLEPVRFAPSMTTLNRLGARIFVEVGPKPILLGMGRQCLPDHVGQWLPSLHPDRDDWQQLLTSLATLYQEGASIDWSGFDGDYSRCRESLPTYPFQRQRYWVEAPAWYRTGQFDRGRGAGGSALEPGANQNGQSADAPGICQATDQSLENDLYEVQWHPRSRSELMSPPEPKHWLIFADGGVLLAGNHQDENHQSVGEVLVQHLQSNGHRTTVVVPGQKYQCQEEGYFCLNPDCPEQFRQLLETVPDIGGVVYLWSLDSPLTHTVADLAAAAVSLCSTLYLVQNLVEEYATLPRLWFVTCGAQPVDEQGAVPGLGQSPLWGMKKAIGLEYPELCCSLVDLDPDLQVEGSRLQPLESKRLFEEIAADDTEDEVAFRNGTRYVPRLVPGGYEEKTSLVLDNQSTYLITGGLGALGLQVARTFVERGSTSLVLVGRSNPKPEVKDWIKDLEMAGVQVTIAQADVADAEKMAEVLAHIDRTLPPLRGIIHTAGVVDFCGLWQQDWQRFTRVLTAKVQGTWTLHALTQDRPLDFFVCFSSLASLLGSHGLASYGAANGFMDAFAHYRRSLGLPGLSVNWGPWAEVGMSARLSEDHQQRLSDWGLREIAPDCGLAILEQFLQQETAQVGVLPIEWSKWLQQFSSLPPFYEQVAPSFSGQKESLDFGRELKQLPTAERRSRLVSQLQILVAKTVGLKDAAQVPLEARFVDLGLDSLMAMELRHHLQSSLGCSVRSTVLFRYPTLAELADYLYQDVLDLASAETMSSPLIDSLTNGSDRTHNHTGNGSDCTRNGSDLSGDTVVPIQPQGSQPPLFFVTGILGSVFDLYPLAKYCGCDRAFYGLRSLGTDEGEFPLTRMEDIAEHHIQAIQKIQPQGPYLLGGHSFGGKVAFEMAQQLRAKGHEVSFLALMDIQVGVPDPEQDVADWDFAQGLTHLANIYGSVLGQDLGIQADTLQRLAVDEQLSYVQLVLKMAGQQLTSDDLKRILAVYRANTQASVQYQVRERYPLPMMLFRAAEVGALGNYLPDEVTTQTDPTWGWGQATALPVQLHLVPGNHFTMMMEPQVQRLAEQVSLSLNQLNLRIED